MWSVLWRFAIEAHFKAVVTIDNTTTHKPKQCFKSVVLKETMITSNGCLVDSKIVAWINTIIVRAMSLNNAQQKLSYLDDMQTNSYNPNACTRMWHNPGQKNSLTVTSTTTHDPWWAVEACDTSQLLSVIRQLYRLHEWTTTMSSEHIAGLPQGLSPSSITDGRLHPSVVFHSADVTEDIEFYI